MDILTQEQLFLNAQAQFEGEQVTRGERTLRRSDELHEKVYRSVFGTFSIQRWVHAAGPKRKIEYVPTDARLGLPGGECSYVLEPVFRVRKTRQKNFPAPPPARRGRISSRRRIGEAGIECGR